MPLQVPQPLPLDTDEVRGSRQRLRLNRQAIKLDAASKDEGHEIELAEIHIASHVPRVGALVRFPKDELPPKPDLLKRADLFLVV